MWSACSMLLQSSSVGAVAVLALSTSKARSTLPFSTTPAAAASSDQRLSTSHMPRSLSADATQLGWYTSCLEVTRAIPSRQCAAGRLGTQATDSSLVTTQKSSAPEYS